ncbi:MAG: glycogen synthase [Spirochaetota bacterium]
MKIAFISPEVYPFAKTGGLADVSFALPKALAKAGHDIRIIMPAYKSINKNQYQLKLTAAPLIITINKEDKYAAILESDIIPNVKTYFIDYENYFARDSLYGDSTADYNDNAERFSFFAKAAIEGLIKIGFKPEIIHCNDWQTGLIPLYLKTIFINNPWFKNTAVIMSVHNAGYQGIFKQADTVLNELNNTCFNIEDLKHHNGISFLKSGILNSDIITTVSKKYAEEIQTKEFGFGLEDIFKSKKECLYGIPNAVDYEIWNPETDRFLPRNYSIKNISLKKITKLEIQKRVAILPDENIPLLGTISRLTFQKGMDILADTLEILFQDEKFQFIISGTGDRRISERFDRLKKMFPRSIGVFWGYEEELEHLLQAGLDISIIPSRYEPCGLTQMYSMKYGTVPVVRATGGLDELVEEWDDRSKKGNGFKFKNLTQEELYNTLRKSIKQYNDKYSWDILQRNGMNYNYTWDDAVKEYEKIYKSAIKSS